MKRRQAPNASRLRFTDEERSDPGMEKPIRDAERAADKWNDVRSKVAGHRRVSIHREQDAQTGRKRIQLHFDEEVTRPRESRHILMDTASAQVHR